MNKIYKLVWSKVRSAWVVTSEIAKGHGKDSSSGRNRKLLRSGVVMALLGSFFYRRYAFCCRIDAGRGK